MEQFDFPAPKDGFVITNFLVVSDQDRSRDFYQKIFDGKVVLERDPVILKVANTWLILNAGGGPTDDKPTVTLETPKDPNRASAFMNIRVADIKKAYKEWSAKGAKFLTEPKDHGREIRAYIRDPDGHLIESGPPCVADLAEVLAHGDRVSSLAEWGEAPGVLDGTQQAVVRFVRDRAESHDRSGRDHQRGHLASSRVRAAAG